MDKRCIYCGTREGAFRSREHVYPESLGNEEVILQPGIVCDACNHGISSQLDECLLNFGPIAILRVMYMERTKSGKRPKASFQNLFIERTTESNVRMVAKEASGGIQWNHEVLPDGSIAFQFIARGSQFRPERLARALFKIGLGFVAFKEGHEAALSTTYHEARAFIRGKGPFRNGLLIQRESTITESVATIYTRKHGGTVFFMDIFGIRFGFNLEEEPRLRDLPAFRDLKVEFFSLDDEEVPVA